MHATKQIMNSVTKLMDPLYRQVVNEASDTPPLRMSRTNPRTTRTAEPIRAAISDDIHGFSHGILSREVLVENMVTKVVARPRLFF